MSKVRGFLGAKPYFIRLSETELVPREAIKHCKRTGNYTEVSLHGEDLWRQIWDQEKELWNQLLDA